MACLYEHEPFAVTERASPSVDLASRSCGGCTLCCKLVGVAELAKPPGAWCTHCEKGRGCRIYADRPGSCRDFACLWLATAMPPEMRPDRTRMVFTRGRTARDVLVHVDPNAFGIWTKPPAAPFLAHLHRGGISIALRCGERRFLWQPDEPRLVEIGRSGSTAA